MDMGRGGSWHDMAAGGIKGLPLGIGKPGIRGENMPGAGMPGTLDSGNCGQDWPGIGIIAGLAGGKMGGVMPGATAIGFSGTPHAIPSGKQPGGVGKGQACIGGQPAVRAGKLHAVFALTSMQPTGIAGGSTGSPLHGLGLVLLLWPLADCPVLWW